MPSSGLKDQMHRKIRLGYGEGIIENGEAHSNIAFVLWGSCLQINADHQATNTSVWKRERLKNKKDKKTAALFPQVLPPGRVKN